MVGEHHESTDFRLSNHQLFDRKSFAVKYLRPLLSLPVVATLLFVAAKLAGWWPLSDWNWAWVFSPLWVDWLTAALAFWMSRTLERTLRFGVSLVVVGYEVNSLSNSTNMSSYPGDRSSDANAADSFG